MTVKHTLYNDSVDQLYKRGDKLLVCPPSSYLFEVLKYPDQVIKCAMGSLGLRIRDIARQIDSEHPELGKVLKGVFSDEATSKRICQYLKLANYAVKEGLDEVQLHRSTLTKAPHFLRSIDTPEKNQQLIRLIADRSLRDKIRGTKSARSVEMRYLLKKGKMHWGQIPQDFSYYVRFSDAYKKDVEESKNRMETYKGLGCPSLSNAVEARISAFSDHMEDTLCGFHRIKMSDAAAIVGKGFGASIQNNAFSTLTTKVSYQVIKKYLYIDPDAEYSPPKPSRHYNFVARAYPYVMLEDIASGNVKRAIDHLESFPENGNKPFFDHYIVVVPSVNYPPEPNRITPDRVRYVFQVEGRKMEFEDSEECAQQLDRVMIKNGDSKPVILGERDGDCYFICYWI